MEYIKLDVGELSKVCTELEDIGLIGDLHLSKDLESVAKIELLLDFLKESGLKNSIEGSYFMCGVYIGEILKGIIGGEWVYVLDVKKIALKVQDEFIFPESPVRSFFDEQANGGLFFFVKAMIAKFGIQKL